MNQSLLLFILALLFALFLPPNDAFLPSISDKSSPKSPLSSSSLSSSSVLYADATDASSSSSSSSSSLGCCLLHGVEKMSKVMTPSFFLESSQPTLKAMYTQCIKNVRVKESSISGAGLGLFAKKNIKSGTIISFYPAHALGVDTDNGDNDQTCFSCLPADEEYFQTHPSTESSYLHCTDQPIFQRTSLLGERKDVPLYLDVNPNRELVDGWWSQMINDGATVESNSEKGVLDYYQASGSKKNCIHIPWGPSPIMATVTTRKVKKGEEFLTSYGGTYWLGVLFDSHGRGEEGAVGITPPIQAKIQETATDLLRSMQTVAVIYEKQADAMHEEFAKL